MSPSKARSVLAVKWGFCPVPRKVLLEWLQKFSNPPAVQVLLSFPTAFIAAGGESLRLWKSRWKCCLKGHVHSSWGNSSISSLCGFLCQKKDLGKLGSAAGSSPVCGKQGSREQDPKGSPASQIYFPLFWWNWPLQPSTVSFYFWKAPLKKKIAAFYTSVIVMLLHVSLPLSIWNVSNKTRL